MPRRPTYLKKSVKLQVERLERKCCYCKTHRSAQGFDKHEVWCKKIWTIRRELQDRRMHSTTNQLQAEAKSVIARTIPSSLIDLNAGSEFVEGSSSMPMEISEYPLLELDLQEPTTAPRLSGTFT
jgi:hypothetical protein